MPHLLHVPEGEFLLFLGCWAGSAGMLKSTRTRCMTGTGVGRFVDKAFRRRLSGRFVDSIINV